MPAPSRAASRAEPRASARAQARAEAARAQQQRRLLWLAAAGVVALLAVPAALGQFRPTSADSLTQAAVASAAPSAAPQAPSDLARRQAGDPAAKGAVDAPVVVIEYADFRCKYCARDDAALRAAVDAEAAQSQALGVVSTPTFVVGDQTVSGAQPREVFRQLIDGQLAAAP